MNWNPYTTKELIMAFGFYLDGPKNNTICRALLKDLARFLVNDESIDERYTVDIDQRLDRFYQEWAE